MQQMVRYLRNHPHVRVFCCKVHERHRHRYEVNPFVVASLEHCGMKLVGRNNDGTGERMEVLELEKDVHPFFMGAQVCESTRDWQSSRW